MILFETKELMLFCCTTGIIHQAQAQLWVHTQTTQFISREEIKIHQDT